MVFSCYVMKLNQTRINMEEYYNDLHNEPLPVFTKHIKRKTKCMVCLQDGGMPMNSVANPSEIKEALNKFADIELHNSKEKQTCILCYVCYKFLKNAILFRKVAQRTNETLKQCISNTKSSIRTIFNDTSNHSKRSSLPEMDSLDYSIEVCEEELEEESNKIPCPICQKFLSRSYFKNHMELHNPNIPPRYVCDVCGKAFKIRGVYNKHKERHETRYIFKCEHCPYAGRYKERLWMHMRVHKGELNYMCTECPARYTTKGSLSDHIKLKHTEPKYKCNSCDKAYHSNINLQRHIDAAHLGIKNHECNVCGKTFGYRKKMLDHQRKIHKMAGLRPNVRRLGNKSDKKRE